MQASKYQCNKKKYISSCNTSIGDWSNSVSFAHYLYFLWELVHSKKIMNAIKFNSASSFIRFANSDSIIVKNVNVLQIFIKSGDTVAEQDINIYSPLSGHYLSQGTALIGTLTSISFAIDFVAETILSEHDDIVSLNEPNEMFQEM